MNRSNLGRADEGRTLGVEDGAGGAVLGEEAVQALADPEGGKDGEGESGPVHEGGGALICKKHALTSE